MRRDGYWVPRAPLVADGGGGMTVQGRVVAAGFLIVLCLAYPSGAQAQPVSSSSRSPTQSFRTEPDFHPPVVNVTSDPDHRSGDIFAGVLFGQQGGPMILNPKGQLVWYFPGRETANFEVQRYRGHPVLTWWQKVGSAPAEEVIMDRSYRTVAIVHGGHGLTPDAHEFLITPQNTAYLSTVAIAGADLSSVGGPANGTVLDDIVQEVDIRTGHVLWEWHSLGHVPPRASYGPVPKTSWPPYDYFHLNSIQQLPNGNLLISARQTWAVYEISRKTGRVIWTLGGKYSDFTVGQGAGFEWQHDARLHGQTLSVFDDADSPPEESQSSAKLLKLNTANRTVSLTQRFTHFPPVLTPEMGSTQTLPNGNVFVGWGPVPQFSEYTATGRQIFNGVFPLGYVFYRIFRFPWIGRPRTPPSLAVSPGADGRVRTYASWNGATQVRSWRVLGGSAPHSLKTLGVTATRSGFETAIGVSSEPKYFAVQALDAKGTVLKTSRPVADPPHLAVFGSSVFTPASGGYAGVPVGCLASHGCRIRVRVSAAGSVLGHSPAQRLSSYRGGIVHVRLPAVGHKESVQVSVRSGAGLSVTRRVTLIPYSAAARRQPPGSRAGGVVLAGATEFVASSTGRAGILTACYASAPCHFRETLSVAGHLAGTSRASVGANEVVYVPVQLNQAARRALGHARGNRLASTVQITARAKTRSTRVDLVRYG
jgi:Arylsulfotransferase (ASST)